MAKRARTSKSRKQHPTLAAAVKLRRKLVQWRRHLHQYPEPSMQEYETAAYVVEQLREIGLDEIRTGVGETGVTCMVRGTRGRKTVALRADMDALEIEEESDVEYASRKPGLMHACGHDGHTACLLGAGAILANMGNKLSGNVKLIFQPAEEGAGGALKMIQDGCLQSPKVSAIAGLHVSTDLKTGTIGIPRGYVCAQTDDINMTVQGQSGHAAAPDKGVDAIAVASQALIAVQQFVARHTSSTDRKLVTFGIIQGGTRRNILADSVYLEGTIRTLEPEGREVIFNFLKRDLRKLVGAMGGRLSVRIMEGYPPLVNDDPLVDAVEAAAVEIVGKAAVVPENKAGLGGEDFAYFSTEGKIPVAMVHLGIRDEKKGFTSPGHSTTFDFDDAKALPIGAALLAQSAIRMLGD